MDRSTQNRSSCCMQISLRSCSAAPVAEALIGPAAAPTTVEDGVPAAVSLFEEGANVSPAAGASDLQQWRSHRVQQLDPSMGCCWLRHGASHGAAPLQPRLAWPARDVGGQYLARSMASSRLPRHRELASGVWWSGAGRH